MMHEREKSNAMARLRRIEGQVAGLHKMVDADRYCVDVLLQVSAVRAALAKVGKLVLEAHIRTCVTEAFEAEDKEERAAKVEELIRVFEKNCSC